MRKNIANVYMLNIAYHVDKLYDYLVPDSLIDDISLGDIVLLPFGNGNRSAQALVWSFSDTSDYDGLKTIQAKTGISLSTEMMELCVYMKTHCFCTIGEAARTMAPAFVVPLLKNYYIVSDSFCDSLSASETKVVDYIKEKGKAEQDNILRALSLSGVGLLSTMVKKGILIRSVSLSERKTQQTERVILNEQYASLDSDSLASLVRGSQQKEILRFLSISGEETMNRLRDESFSRASVVSLVKAGFARIETEKVDRDPYSELTEEKETPILSDIQKNAADEISAVSSDGKAGAALLYGVTGSGKTAVIGEVIDRTIKSGKQAILLVPEISLTPQTVGVFYNRYKGRVAVLHSALSDGERFDAWNKIKNGEKDLVIGTRSAVFAPFSNLGLIVLDEEHEGSYKSESNPKYHARDIARFRCVSSGSTLLLASATPSLDSFSKAKEGKYKLVTLANRFGGASLPDIVFADMRGSGTISPIGDKLFAALNNVLSRKEQAILFINRRGYNNFLTCTSCGKAITCPHCSVSYSYHASKSNFNRGYLYCHYCGNKEHVPSVCPICGGGPFAHIGYGTQMVEEELNRLFPDAKVLRMDSDSMTGKMSYDNLLGRFKNGDGDILVGTQMVTKGHDFPNVTLVGVINADAALYQSSYTASERAFSLFTQVIGRAGRSVKHGMALLQTFSPNAPLLSLVSDGDYTKMYEEEIALRRSLVFPPYCNLAVFTLSSADEKEMADYAFAFAEKIRQDKSIVMSVFGPMDAPVYRINGVYHTRIVIKCRLNKETRQKIAEFYSEALKNAGARISTSVDIDPTDL